MTSELFTRKVELEEDGIYFARFFFKHRFGTKLIVGRHHYAIQDALDRTMLPPDHPDFISRIIINVPPGYTKTELCCMNYIARGLSKNPMARFLHVSFSDKLVLQNSSVSREIVKSKEFQQLWNVPIKQSTDSKHIWYTEQNGGVVASPAGGQVTGFRAGHMDYSQFTGAIIIDDPVKPEDAHSEKIRTSINHRYNETIASRVSISTNPIIVIMQRIHWDDLSGYLLRGGSGDKWHHLNLPVVINNDEQYPAEYTHGIPIAHGLENGWLWPFKHNSTHESILKAHRRTYQSQYMQSPLKRDSDATLWRDTVIQESREKELDGDIVRTVIAVDPAATNTEASDEHGIIVASEYESGTYSIDADFSRRGSPLDWAMAVIHAANDFSADAVIIETNQGGDMCISNLRNAGYQGRIIKTYATKGKTLRAEPIVSLYELNKVKHFSGLDKLENEMLDFDPISQKSNGKSPNRVDAAVYALTELAKFNLGNLLDIANGV